MTNKEVQALLVGVNKRMEKELKVLKKAENRKFKLSMLRNVLSNILWLKPDDNYLGSTYEEVRKDAEDCALKWYAEIKEKE